MLPSEPKLRTGVLLHWLAQVPIIRQEVPPHGLGDNGSATWFDLNGLIVRGVWIKVSFPAKGRNHKVQRFRDSQTEAETTSKVDAHQEKCQRLVLIADVDGGKSEAKLFTLVRRFFEMVS